MSTNPDRRDGCDIMCVVGARPNFMKIAPVIAALATQAPALRVTLLHTGQHYDQAMSRQYFEALGIPRPDIDLEVGPGSHAMQTAEIMRRFEPALERLAPRALLVVGDVNSTLACALVAAKKQVPVIHVEAGLRSFDRSMPEEINRVLTDQISTLLFTTESDARDNLLREGIPAGAIHHVGNVMIDTLRASLGRAVSFEQSVSPVDRDRFKLRAGNYAVLTLHRPSNVDDPAVLATLADVISQVSRALPVLFPVHPRTAAMLEKFGLLPRVRAGRVALLAPAGYLEMLGLMKDARLVLTDSGGIQEETTALGVPCLTLREATERPVTVIEGTNTVVGRDPARILAAVDDVLLHGGKTGRIPAYWDGKASIRIADVLRDWIGDRMDSEVWMDHHIMEQTDGPPAVSASADAPAGG
ncbi:non-hydrolyzing UDP-N-acetylglucosamine 2-epimerase [Lacisediminimonas profundi]|uniref:non-hydrolyzing UDP-N-acetylglucosamine 2-epimerase n=1 Tax=Lacisediminimonas profundi TaxID=2603856 RepID=UPI00124B9AFA|nr:UDP-N-acetylglucosamine 2-epimerase (non-hydrolyzing) [Lacisediminimonas profundi]